MGLKLEWTSNYSGNLKALERVSVSSYIGVVLKLGSS